MSFETRSPSIAAWIQNGWIDLGCDDFNHSFIRVLDLGGMVWEGGDRYDTVDAALADAEAAIEKWLEEH